MSEYVETSRTSEAAAPGGAPAGGVLTIADALALPVLAAGRPEVLTGVSRLDRPVRWVHITELTDPASFLKGGELVLTTGMPLPQDTAGVRRYVDELADIGAAALVIELVRRYHRPPDALIQACRTRGPRSSPWPRTSTSWRSPRSSTPSSSATRPTPCAGPSASTRRSQP